MSAGKWRKKWAEKVRNPEDMVRFVEAVGCCTGKPLLKYPEFPSQYEALGEVNPGVPDIWFWKDDLHTEKRVYYTRVFGSQPGFLSYPLLPVFIATNGAVADELIFNGLLSPEAQQVYRAIESYGPISTIDLKRMLTPDAKHSADRVLINLDRQFIITKVGITGRTLGIYSYIWDLVERWVPEMLIAADRLGRKQAESMLHEHLAAFEIPSDSLFYTKVLRLRESKGI
ncbi:MAG: hypothetical protein ABFD46_07850 [Armatimonadota bacterium]